MNETLFTFSKKLFCVRVFHEALFVSFLLFDYFPFHETTFHCNEKAFKNNVYFLEAFVKILKENLTTGKNDERLN